MSETKRKHATKAEMQKRLEEVITCLALGYPVSQIRKTLVEHHGLTDKTARRTINAAQEIIAANGNQSIDIQLGLLRYRSEKLFLDASVGDAKNPDRALKVMELQRKLLMNTKGGQSTHDTTETAPGDIITSRLEEILGNLPGNGDDPQS